MTIPFLAQDDEITPFPPVNTALSEPNGLVMAGGSLAPQRLLNAYRAGIFPWYEAGEPILWWSPDPRCVIWPADIKESRSLKKSIRSAGFRITEDRCFRNVMELCAAPRAGSTGTWVTADMIDAYCELHRFGITRSIEVWIGEELVGGLYGVELGRVFVGESMFSRQSNASKAALVHLARCARYDLVDCQLETDHLLSMGATTISRDRYIELLSEFGDLDAKRFTPEKLK